MKNFIINIIMGMIFACGAVGQEIHLDKDLPAPSSSSMSMPKEGHAFQLKEMLDNKELEKFYKSAPQSLKELSNNLRDKRTKAELNDFIWTLYFVSGAPLYELELETDQNWPYNGDEDLLMKSTITGYMVSFDVENASKLLGVSQQHLKNTISVYFASLLKTFKASLIPDANKQAKTFQNNIDEKARANFDAYRVRCSKYNSLARRDNGIRFYMESIMESRFIDMLIKYFPKNSAEVIKYIKMAGYQDNEIFPLLERTVGSAPKASYLMRGKIGAEYKRKLRQDTLGK